MKPINILTILVIVWGFLLFMTPTKSEKFPPIMIVTNIYIAAFWVAKMIEDKK